MRTLVITQTITLDGPIEMIGDCFDAQAAADDMMAELRRKDESAEAVLLGRQTFEDFRSFWPRQADDPTGISDYLNQVQKYVVSSTLTDPGWEPTTVLDGDVVAAVRELKEQPGQDVVVTGSITLTHALIAAGLVDEYRLFTYPVVQGRGRRLFPDGVEVPRLRRLDAKTFGSGVTYAAYAPVG